MNDWLRNTSEWIRRSFRGILTLAAMGVFLSLVHSLVHFDLSDKVVGIIGGALLLSAQWVSKFVNSYTSVLQSDDEG